MATHSSISGGSTSVGDIADQYSSGGAGCHHQQRHHAIARVASAHGHRDSILSFQHHPQPPVTQQQQQHYGRHQSPSPYIAPANVPSARSVGGSAPPALCSAVGQPTSISIPPPPQYEQAVAAAAAVAANNHDIEQASGSHCGAANNAKFPTRKSPESRTPVQAVLPMQPSVLREVIPSPTSIPDECQVVKQLVREMASGQLSMLGNGDGGLASVQAAMVETAPPPPAYVQHQQRFQNQQPISRQQQQQQIPSPSSASSQYPKTSNAHHRFTASSTAHPLLEGALNTGGSSALANVLHDGGHLPSPSQNEMNTSGQRMSLSNPDLSRLQNLQLSAWQGAAVHVDDPVSGSAAVPGGGTVPLIAAALNPTSAPLIKGQQKPISMHNQQLLQRQQQQQQVSSSAILGQPSVVTKLLEHGISLLPAPSTQPIGGPMLGNRLTNVQSQQSFPADGVPSYNYEMGLHHELPYVQPGSLSSVLTSGYPPSMLSGATAASSSMNSIASDFVQRASVEAYEADLEANAFTRMINLLKDENKNLRSELESYVKKTFKLQQLELQYQKLYREYEDLVRRQEKREELEQQMANKMRQDNSRLRDLNNHLRDQLESAVAQMAHLHADDAEDAEVRRELIRLEMMMAQLITQNKELVACKERQEIELEAQRQTLDDQREHIQVLDRALMNTQDKNLRLDEECKKKSTYVQRAEQLQRMVQQLQETIQKSEENHKRVRAELEKELAKQQLQKKDVQLTKQSSSSRLQEINDTLAKLKRELRDKDDQLSGLQQDAVRWQNLYYEEAKKRQTELDEAADSKDARIRVLEETSDKAEKMAESARVESKRYLDDLRTSKSRVGDLETKIQNLEARIAEKDAMINVLRRRQNVPYGDSTVNARSADATLTEPYNPHETKQRLEAVRRRLLQSPSPSRYAPRFYQRHGHKFTSIDASFSLDSDDYASLGRPARRNKTSSTAHAGNSSMVSGGSPVVGAAISASNETTASRTQHSRTQSSCDSYLSPSSIGRMEASTGSALGTFKQREIFTLPTRRSRTKLLTTEQAKSIRPRSADDHLRSRSDSSEETDGNALVSGSVIDAGATREGTAVSVSTKGGQDGEDNAEELWHV